MIIIVEFHIGVISNKNMKLNKIYRVWKIIIESIPSIKLYAFIKYVIKKIIINIDIYSRFIPFIIYIVNPERIIWEPNLNIFEIWYMSSISPMRVIEVSIINNNGILSESNIIASENPINIAKPPDEGTLYWWSPLLEGIDLHIGFLINNKHIKKVVVKEIIYIIFYKF